MRAVTINCEFTQLSILHARGRSLFRFQTSRETRMAMLELEIPEPRPLIRALEGPKVLYIYSIGSEI